MQPLIGITAARTTSPSGLPQFSVVEAYARAISQASACPVLIPPSLSDDELNTLVQRLDGVLFSGGGDIDPFHYGFETHPKVGEVDPDRDQVELHLLQKVVQEAIPFLGICRGLQLVNVGLGGTLYADIPDQYPGGQKHDFYPGWSRSHLAHEVRVDPDSRLASILGLEPVEVNSLHHQAVRQIAPGLRPTAYSPDGLVEGVELPDHPFGLAVQWHPEWLTAHAPMQALFRAFVEAANVKIKK